MYALLLIIMVIQAIRAPTYSNPLMVYMLIYNFLISEICLYLIYKPFQYYHLNIMVLPDYDKHNHAICEIDSIQNSNVKELLSYSIWISFFLAACHVGYIIYKLIFYCKICIKSKRNENRGRQQSINIKNNYKIINGVDNKYYKLSSIEAKSYACKWFCIGGTVLCTMLFFLCLSIYCTVIMIKAGMKNKGEYDAWKKTIICIVMTLLFLSLFDSPLIWLKIYEKCKERNDKKVALLDGMPPEPL